MAGQQKVRLTEAEKRDYGEKIGQLLAELNSVKATKKSVTKDFGVQIEALENRIYEVGEALRHGYEWRDAPTLPFEDPKAAGA